MIKDLSIEKKRTILIVDDSVENLDILVNHLKHKYRVRAVKSGSKAIEVAIKTLPDLILLDIMMPEMSGYEVCYRLKENLVTKNIPIVFITSLNEAEDEQRGLELGAVDFISKPFNMAVVEARVHAHISLLSEREKTEHLLKNILPEEIIEELKTTGQVIPRMHDNVSILFSDLVGFTEISSRMSPENLIAELSAIFTGFDMIVDRWGGLRIKTIGDGYMAVTGLPRSDLNHAAKAVKIGLELIRYLEDFESGFGINWKVRVGINSGKVMAGVVGTGRYSYDIFGDAVNIASRVENSAEAMTLSITDDTFQLIKEAGFVIRERGVVELKGKGSSRLYYVES